MHEHMYTFHNYIYHTTTSITCYPAAVNLEISRGRRDWWSPLGVGHRRNGDALAVFPS